MPHKGGERGNTQEREACFFGRGEPKNAFPEGAASAGKAVRPHTLFFAELCSIFLPFSAKKFLLFAAWYLCVLPFGEKKNASDPASAPASVQGGLYFYHIIFFVSCQDISRKCLSKKRAVLPGPMCPRRAKSDLSAQGRVALIRPLGSRHDQGIVPYAGSDVEPGRSLDRLGMTSVASVTARSGDRVQYALPSPSRGRCPKGG